MSATESMDIVDKLTAIDLKAATSAGEIAEGLAQFANIGSLMGVNIDQAASYVATIADVTQMSGSSAGQAMKMIISRYGNVKAGAFSRSNLEATGDDGEAINDVERVLNKLGITMRKSHSEFKDFDETLDEIASKWAVLDNISQKAIATAFAGVRQQEAFITLMQNWSKYQELLEVSETSKGTATTKYQSYQEGLAAATKRLVDVFEDLVNKDQIGGLLTKLVDGLTKIADAWLPTLIKYIPQLILLIQDVRAIKGTSWLNRLGDGVMNRVSGEGGFLRKTGRFFFGKGTEQTERLGGMMRRGQRSGGSKEEGDSQKTAANLAKAEASSEKIAANLQRGEQATKEAAENETVETLESKEQVLQAEKGKLLAEQQTHEEQIQTLEGKAQLGDEQAKTALAHERGMLEGVNDQIRQKTEELQTVEKQKQLLLERQKTQETVKQTTATTASKTGGRGWGGQIVSGLLSGATIGLSSLAGWFMAKQTANRTHTNRLGESVTSSKTAAARGASVEAAWSALPFFGTMIGSAVADSLMADIDKVYDEIRITTEQAQKAVTVLTKIGSSVSSLKDFTNSFNYQDMIETNRVVDEMLAELYSEEGEESRRTIEKYLPGLGSELHSMFDLLQKFKNESYEGRREIANQLELAQVKAKNEQEKAAAEQEKFERQQKYQESIEEHLGNLDKYMGDLGLTSGQKGTAFGKGLLAALPMTGAFAGGGALGGALIGAKIGSGGGLAGTLVGLAIGAIVGLIAGGTTAGNEVAQSVREQYLSENAAAFAAVRTPQDLIDELRNLENALVESIDKKGGSDKDYEDLSNVRKALEEAQEYQDFLFGEAKKDDLREARVAMLETTGETGKTIGEMSLGQLKKMGITGVYEAFAEQVMKNGGLQTISPFVGGVVSQDFIDMVTSMLEEDPELALLLSGYGYTVAEATELNQDDLFNKRVVEQFATALHITVKELDQMAGIIPDLKLADLLKNTSELEESVNNYEGLFSSLRSGTEETSKWMTQITNEFPELVAYMDDVPTLMTKIISRIRQLNEVVIAQQYNEIEDSDTVFKERFLPDIQAYILDKIDRGALPQDALPRVEALMDSENIDSAKRLRTYLASNPQDEVSQWLREAATEAMGAGYDLTADLLKPQYQQYTSYIADLWKKQLENLEEQKNMLSEMSKQREYELNLLRAQLKLQEAINEKRRVYRAGVGWVYEADQGKIQEAEKELEDLEVTKQISEITKQINETQYMVTKWESIWQTREAERTEEQVEAFMEEFGLNDGNGLYGTKFSSGLNEVFGAEGLFGKPNDTGNSIFGKFNDVISGINGVSATFSEEFNKWINKDKVEREQALTDINAWSNRLLWADQHPDLIGAGEYNSWLSHYTKLVNDANTRNFLSDEEYNDYIARYKQKDVANPAYKVSQAYAYAYNQNVSRETQRTLDFLARESANGYSFEAAPLQISQTEDGSYYISFKEQSNDNLIGQGFTKPSALRRNSNGELVFDTGKNSESSLTVPESFLKLISVGKTKDGGTSYLYQYDPRGEVLPSGEIGQILLSTSVAASPLYDTVTASEFRSKFAESRIFFNNNGEGTILPATNNNLPTWLQLSSRDSGFQSYFTNRASKEDFFIEVDGVWYFISHGKAYLAKTAQDMAAFAYMQGDSWLLTDPSGEANYQQWLAEMAAAPERVPQWAVRQEASSQQVGQRRALGGYLSSKTQVLLNELGTEAIITPQGTLTTLPGHTGIVPADITANLWALGEVAPNLLRAFGDMSIFRNNLIPASVSTDESFNISNLTMNVSADKSFDADAFVQSIKNRVALTKNTRR